VWVHRVLGAGAETGIHSGRGGLFRGARVSDAIEVCVQGAPAPMDIAADLDSYVAPPPNKQLQRTVERHRGRAASASFHYAHAARWTVGHAAAELRR